MTVLQLDGKLWNSYVLVCYVKIEGRLYGVANVKLFLKLYDVILRERLERNYEKMGKGLG